MSASEPALTIPRMVSAAAAEYGDHLAVVDGETRVSYRELGELTARAARAYVASGIGTGDRVAVWAPNRLEFIVAMLGAQSVGASVIPMNTRYRGYEAAVILERSRASVVVLANGFLDTDFGQMLRSAAAEKATPSERGPVPGLPHLKTVVDINGTASTDDTESWTHFLSRADEVSRERGDEIAAAVSPDDVCDILFTSGTTGIPKGVMSAHRQTLETGRVWARGARLTPEDRYAIVNPFFHGFGYKAGLMASLVAGTTIYPVAVFTADSLLDLIQSARISVLPGAPTLFISLLDHPRLADYDISSLRFSIAGSANVPESLFHRMVDELGFEQVAQAYGLTECLVATLSRPNEDLSHVAETTGPVVEGLEIRIVDPKGNDLPVGEDGEILLRGTTVMLGYFEDEAATKATIDDDGWMKTGDVGRLDEHGCVKITDRIKDMFTVGGFNVYPGEVENALASHPSVSECAVIGVPDERMGAVAWAFILARPGSDTDESELIAYCRTRLANYKVPRKIVVLEDFPRNASGKILKTEIRNMAPAS